MMDHDRTASPQNISPEMLTLYQAAFENSNEAIAVLNRDGEIILANKRSSEFLGITGQQLTGKTLFEIFPKEVAENYYADIQEVFDNGSETAAELPAKINDHTRWFQSHLKPLFDAQGNVIYVFSHIIETTEHKQAIELLNNAALNLQILLENSHDLIFISDNDRRIILYNDAAANHVRITQDMELKPGMGLDEISKDEGEKELWKQMHEQALEGKAFRDEIILGFPGGEQRYFETSFQPIDEDGQIVGLAEFTRDITERKLAELALTESEERFRQLAENVNEVFWISTPDWRKILYISSAYEEVWGRSRESLYEDASSWWTVVVNEDLSKLETELAVKIGGDLSNPNFPEYRIQRPDGTIRWISARSFPIYDDEGTLIRIAGIAEDITERKRIETAIRKSEARYRNLFSTMFNGFVLYEVICDDEGTPVDFLLLEVNRAFEKMTNLKAEDIVGKTLLEITPEAELHWRDMFIRVCTTGQPEQLQDYSQDFDKYFTLYAYRPEPGQFAIVFADVTKQVLAEKELQKFNEELEQRVKERTDQLERQNKDMESFSYSVSHDLRAPLRAISGFGQILLDEYASNWEEEPSQLLERMIRAGQKMDALIDGLLVLSRISQVGLDIESVNLSSLAEQAFELLSSSIKGREINFTAHDTPNVKGDPRLMEAVLTNLISNAIKFSGNKKIADIEFGHFKKDDLDIYYLKDNGIGFNMKYTDKLFAPFQRFDAQTEIEGTGIGLTIVQQIIERHQGNVWAESHIGEGTTFYFHL
jgi:PAS domain S-box-containing protein